MRRTSEKDEGEETATGEAKAAPTPVAPAVANVIAMQQGAGNAAVSRMLARDKDEDGKSGGGGSSGSWQSASPQAGPQNQATIGGGRTLPEMVAAKNIDGIVAKWNFIGADREDVRAAIRLILEKGTLTTEEKDAVDRLWQSRADRLSDDMHLWQPLWQQSVDAGVLLSRWTLWDYFDILKSTGPEVITPHQAGRVGAAVNDLSPDDFKKFRRLIYWGLSPIQRAYIAKALAAGRSIADIEAFADKIRKQSDSWLKDKLNVVEESGEGGTGIKQQWQMSCGPTTVQVLHAQTDPIYALSLNEGGDINKTGAGDVSKAGGNQTMKDEQGNMLKGAGSAPTELGVGGTGMWAETNMDALKKATGLKYTYTGVTAVEPKNAKDSAIDKAFTAIADFVEKGMYVPIVIGGTPGQTAHYNMVLRHDASKGLMIHDPGEGKSGWCTRQMFLDNKLAPPLSWKLLAGYDVPSKA